LQKILGTLLVCAVVCTTFLAGCSKNESAAPESDGVAPKQNQEPVTLKFYTKTAMDDFDKYINRFVKKKFPHVTLQLVENAKGSTIENLVTAGEIPDIIWEGLTNMGGALAELDLPMDLAPVAKKAGSDFSKYEPSIIDSIKSYSTKGEILFLPYNVLAMALHYNKDVFDKFAIPYPKDNLTWDQAIELGNTLTRKDGDVQYIGLRSPNIVNRMRSQLSIPYLDSAGKPIINSDGWKQLFDTYQKIHSGLDKWEVKNFNEAKTQFMQDRTLAMFPEILQLQNTDMVDMEKKGLRWDIATYPTFSDRPGVGNGVFADGFVLPKGGKHTDLAFQIISYLSTDPEVQLEATKNGRITVLKDPKIQEHAFENNAAAQGKNLKAAFTPKYPSPPQVTPYDSDGQTIINKKLLELVNKKTDVNTLLRQAQEEFTQKIAETKAR
jgi:multiple sugar transport system substrate-binding protein